MKSVFISYSNDDSNKVKIIEKELLKTAFFKPIIIANNREPLISLSDKVIKGLQESEIIIPILTKHSIHTQWINQEIGYATADTKKKILPIVESDIFDKLKGFIHKQLDLPYSYLPSIDKKSELTNFKKCLKSLIDDLLKENGLNRINDENDSVNNFNIISPSEVYTTEKWVEISGIGAPPNYKILLFTWLGNRTSFLQNDISTSDDNGKWFNQKCHLSATNTYRKIYAIAVESKQLDEVKKVYREFGKQMEPSIFYEELWKKGIKSKITNGIKLIRLEKD